MFIYKKGNTTGRSNVMINIKEKTDRNKKSNLKSFQQTHINEEKTDETKNNKIRSK